MINYGALKFAKGESRFARKQQARIEEAKALRRCYAAVDARDRRQCRVCRKRTDPNAIGLLDRGQHHHLVYRSRGGDHHPRNVLTLCSQCHQSQHGGLIRLSGDADHLDPLTGKWNGVKLERYSEAGWSIDRWI
jgi:5-methylcytosine-specific restriction endonuclease McrA